MERIKNARPHPYPRALPGDFVRSTCGRLGILLNENYPQYWPSNFVHAIQKSDFFGERGEIQHRLPHWFRHGVLRYFQAIDRGDFFLSFREFPSPRLSPYPVMDVCSQGEKAGAIPTVMAWELLLRLGEFDSHKAFGPKYANTYAFPLVSEQTKMIGRLLASQLDLACPWIPHRFFSDLLNKVLWEYGFFRFGYNLRPALLAAGFPDWSISDSEYSFLGMAYRYPRPLPSGVMTDILADCVSPRIDPLSYDIKHLLDKKHAVRPSTLVFALESIRREADSEISAAHFDWMISIVDSGVTEQRFPKWFVRAYSWLRRKDLQVGKNLGLPTALLVENLLHAQPAEASDREKLETNGFLRMFCGDLLENGEPVLTGSKFRNHLHGLCSRWQREPTEKIHSRPVWEQGILLSVANPVFKRELLQNLFARMTAARIPPWFLEDIGQPLDLA